MSSSLWYVNMGGLREVIPPLYSHISADYNLPDAIALLVQDNPASR